MMLEDIPANLIWLRPAWLLAIPVLLLWLWYLSKRSQGAGWHKHIAVDKLDLLKTVRTPTRYYRYFAIPVVIACIALAGPALVTMPTGTADSRHATVLVFDLSPSMLARDLKPDRLTQARYKAADILRQHEEGEIALIAYAANAYRVTPLTDDPATIEALLPTMHPEIMPVPGSNTESALAMAAEMLHESGVGSGDILLITDGVANAAQAIIASNAPGTFRLSILGVGTSKGATIPTESGLLTDENQQPIVARLNGSSLKKLARSYNGRYAEWTTDSSDIQYLINQKRLSRVALSAKSYLPSENLKQFDRFRDQGYWLLPILVFLAVISFRKNVLVAVIPAFFLLPPEANSIELSDLWLNRDQQAHAQLTNGKFDEAYRMFTHTEWKAIAAYQNGDFTESARLLETPTHAEDLYNRGSALALSGDLKAALKSLMQAIQLYGDNEKNKRADAIHNINVIKQLIKQNNDSAAEEDQNQRPRGSDSSNTRNTDDPEESDPSAANNAQASIGGSTAPGETLNQASLADNMSSSTHYTEDSHEIQPTDASERSARDSKKNLPDNQPAPGDGLTITATIEDNNNSVLSPYNEQWLRSLPQDPGGYLRRKFLYLHQLQSLQTDSTPQTQSTRY